ncbi:DUF2919 family protein [Alteromonas lipolytica]|uniref:DUF2919 domain-containing protein n=1 Tax=Alteromonas lipolytica TaxID=1856405 RepID=A0A1E8FGK3_9ALTE|nr:DUF2919 family protein [Alteromonas lipolytica]OFI35072.1 hypothetical protein BFC17_16100 [Alteromonas lipolytica]GGF56405.1 hypothetical protein GCM10011338_05870 [Alteromonas lipolytica]
MIPLPLKHYDEAGTVLAPRWFYWMLAIACRDLLLVVAFTAIPAESARLYRLFFPHSDTLWLQVVATLPFLLVVLLVSFREQLWQHGYTGWRLLIKPLCSLGALFQLGVVVSFLQRAGWQFDGYLGSVVMVLVTFIYMVNRSHHIDVMLKDWRQPPVRVKQN